MKTSTALTLLSVALVGCSGTSGPAATTVTATVVPPTVTVTATVQAAEPSVAKPQESAPSETAEPSAAPARKTYGPNGAYAVGRAQGGLENVIPPGRYQATGDLGYLHHCPSVVCQQGADNATSTDSINGDTPVIVEIPSTDVAVYLWDVTLVGPVS
jgi:hypothetical protein